MYTAQLENIGPFVIRYPRGPGVISDWRKPMEKLDIGKGRCISRGEKVSILSIGHAGNLVANIVDKFKKEKISIGHYDLRFLKPIDETLLHEVFQNYESIITVEDGTIIGGFGSTIIEFMNDNQYKARIIRLGIPDRFIEHGTQSELYRECGYDENSIYKTVKDLLK